MDWEHLLFRSAIGIISNRNERIFVATRAGANLVLPFTLLVRIFWIVNDKVNWGSNLESFWLHFEIRYHIGVLKIENTTHYWWTNRQFQRYYYSIQQTMVLHLLLYGQMIWLVLTLGMERDWSRPISMLGMNMILRASKVANRTITTGLTYVESNSGDRILSKNWYRRLGEFFFLGTLGLLYQQTMSTRLLWKNNKTFQM